MYIYSILLSIALVLILNFDNTIHSGDQYSIIVGKSA